MTFLNEIIVERDQLHAALVDERTAHKKTKIDYDAACAQLAAAHRQYTNMRGIAERNARELTTALTAKRKLGERVTKLEEALDEARAQLLQTLDRIDPRWDLMRERVQERADAIKALLWPDASNKLAVVPPVEIQACEHCGRVHDPLQTLQQECIDALPKITDAQIEAALARGQRERAILEGRMPSSAETARTSDVPCRECGNFTVVNDRCLFCEANKPTVTPAEEVLLQCTNCKSMFSVVKPMKTCPKCDLSTQMSYCEACRAEHIPGRCLPRDI